MPSKPITSQPAPEINCDTCDAACCRLQVLLIGDNDIPDELTEMSDWGGQVMSRHDDGWCVAVDRATMRCNIYEKRSQICRDFEMGSIECEINWSKNQGH